MAFVTIRIKGSEGYTRVALGKDRMVLGRSSETDIPIRHTSISREHCAFLQHAGEWMIEDLGSSNGTWVGKEKVNGRGLLKEKDVVKVGQARLTFHAGEMSEPEAAIDLNLKDDDDPASGTGGGELSTRGPNDPPEATACPTCGGWFSVAHHVAGDSMSCPHCGASTKVPNLV
ncbi:MAG: FHA domain-containing protein [Planctomycetes bacterium]|nr:FHA domain-containing protein [Planctomycetota bacterium]